MIGINILPQTCIRSDADVRWLRRDAPPELIFTPVIMLTTEAGDAMKQQGQAAGARAWVVKPFQPAQMLTAVSKLVLP